jgi:serine/threonine protein kinase
MAFAPSGLTAALADRYRIERELGQGGMATVYLAEDLKNRRKVALKVLRPELAALLGTERFLAEIRTTANLQHPHILPLHDSGEAGGLVFYVMPYVAGESLRQRLTREKQLSLDDALAIVREIGDALSYAHRQGVIHRDIKPENILLHEGHALLADFGIALAVRQAGGERLTESGLSLGTPQYMSPEQATGDRELDPRSDLYSLAAVLYEMMAGEPPHTGPTVQAVIAKLLTERPTRLRTVRPTVPEGVDNAVAKALAKVPADRFPSVDPFMRALDPATTAQPVPATAPTFFRGARFAVAGAILLLVGLGVWFGLRRSQRPAEAAYRNRTQLTFTGHASHPALSPDGTQLAYAESDCGAGICRFGVEVQDLAGGGARRVLDGASFIWVLQWSPDRRFLIVAGILGGRIGNYLVPILGGPARFLVSGYATFTLEGDSLLVTERLPTDTTLWVWVATLDGTRRDSFPVQHPSGSLLGAFELPGRNWSMVGMETDAGVESRIVDRRGIESDRIAGLATPPRTSGDAVWFDWSQFLIGHGPLIRVPLDPARGKFGAARDTILDLAGQGFDVTSDGGTVAYADGTYEYGLWTLELDQALRGHFEPGRRLLASTSWLMGWPSPDGSRVLAMRTEASPAGSRLTLSILPFAGGPGLDIQPGSVLLPWAGWTRDGRAAYATKDASGIHFGTADAETGAVRQAIAIPDSGVFDFGSLADSGWAWIPASQSSIRVQYPGDKVPRDLSVPPGVGLVVGLQIAPDGRRLAIEGIGRGDSLLVYQIALPRGTTTRMAGFAHAFQGDGSWLDDARLLILVAHQSPTFTLYRVDPGHVDSLGTIPGPLTFARITRDGRRVAVTTVEFHGDIWLARRSQPRR